MTETRESPAFLDIDLASEQGVALLGSVADSHGPRIARAAGLAARLFLLRSPWAPGLRFVGGETRPRAARGEGPPGIVFSLSGSGETLEGAFVSCVGEGVERLAQIEDPDDVAVTAGLPEVEDRVWSPVGAVIAQELRDGQQPAATPLAWIKGQALDPERGFAASRDVLLPADWCLRRAAGGCRLKPRTALSVGVAGGPDFDWAAARALLELVERDAASLWWVGGQRGRPVALDDPAMAESVRLIAMLRQQAAFRCTWLLDITTDIGIPVIAALSCDHDGRRLAYGLAARLSLVEASRAAILELCQTELAILLAQIRQGETGDASLPPSDRLHVERAVSIDANSCELLHPLGIALPHRQHVDGADLSAVATAMAGAGIEAALVDLTRPEFGIAVVRAVAPALQPMPSEAVTDRLQRAATKSGGGARHTGGLALI